MGKFMKEGECKLLSLWGLNCVLEAVSLTLFGC